MSNGIDFDQAEIKFKDKRFCFTGEFKYSGKRKRKVCEKATIELGGIIDDDVRKSTTNYLVVGELGSEAWKNGPKGGNKIKKAKNFRIPVVSEEQWVEALGRYQRAA